MDFKPGDVVVHHKGGLKMTVEKSAYGFTMCVWIDEKKNVQNSTWPTNKLKLIEDEPKKEWSERT